MHSSAGRSTPSPSAARRAAEHIGVEIGDEITWQVRPSVRVEYEHRADLGECFRRADRGLDRRHADGTHIEGGRPTQAPPADEITRCLESRELLVEAGQRRSL